MEDKIEQKVFVYVGQTETGDGKLSYKYFELDVNGNPDDSKMIILGKPMGKHSATACGAIYQCTVTNETRFNVGTASYRNMYHDADEVLEWNMQHRARVAAFKKRTADKKEMNENPMYKELEKIREIYGRTHPNQRSFMLGNIIEFITR